MVWAIVRSPRRRALGVGTLAFIIGVAAGWAIIAGQASAPSPVLHRSTIDLHTDPIGPGAETTDGVAPVLNQLPFPALLPERDETSADVTRTWTRVAVEPAFAVQLQSGVMIMERPAEIIAFSTDGYYQQLGEGVLELRSARSTALPLS